MKLDLPDKIFGLDPVFIKIFIVPAVLVGAWAFTIIGVLLPKISEIIDNNSKALQLIQDRKTMEAKKKYLMSVDEEMIKKNSDALDMAMLKSKDSYVLVNVIRKVVNQFGFDIDSFSVTPGEIESEAANDTAATIKSGKTGKTSVKAKQNELVKVPVKIVIVGPSDKFVDLVAGIERTLPILTIEKLDNKLSRNLSEVTMVVSSYFSTEKTSVKINNLSLKDLTLNQEESDLISKISEYSQVSGTGVVDAKASGKTFTKYERGNPFTP